MSTINVREYSNETNINIIPKETMELLTLEVFNTISNNLSKSYGPLGSYTMILNGYESEATKDGYSILNKYAFNNRYKNMIYNLIKAPCTKMNNTVGDGTTTAICLTNALYNEYQVKKKEISNLYRLPREFNKAWDSCINELVEYVKDNSKRIDHKDEEVIYNLAYVSSNGNEEISNEIKNIYKKSPSPEIKQKDSPTNKSYVEPIEGFDFKCNLLSDAFATNEDLSVKLKDIVVLVMNYKLEASVLDQVIIPLYKVIQARGQKLLVVAPFYDSQMCETKVDQYIKLDKMKSGGDSSLILSIYKPGDLKKHDLHDLCVILGCKTVTQQLMEVLATTINTDGPDKTFDDIFDNDQSPVYRLLGNAEEAMLSVVSSGVFKNDKIKETKEYKDTVRRAKSELANIKANTSSERQIFASKIFDATRRVNQLLMKNFIYYVGANSLLQKQIIWDSVEDVIKSVSSAVKSGVVPGCQITIMRGCKEIQADILSNYEPNEDGMVELTKEDLLKYMLYDIILSSVVDTYVLLLNGPENKGIGNILKNEIDLSSLSDDDIKTLCKNKYIEILNNSIEKNEVFDIDTLEYNPNIITSAETDTMVLTVASELVKMLIEGNSCVFIDPEFAGTHDTTLEEHLLS